MTNSKNNRYVENVLEKIKEAYNIKTDASLARFLDMQPNTLAMQKKRGSLNWFRIFQKCRDIDKNWLLHTNNNVPSTNETLLWLPYIKRSSISSGTALLNKISLQKKVIFPNYLLPNDLIKYTDQLILIKMDRTHENSQVSNGDILLTHLKVNQPIENKYYLVGYRDQILLTRIGVQSKNQLILIDRKTKNKHEKIHSQSNELMIIGRVHWIGSKI